MQAIHRCTVSLAEEKPVPQGSRAQRMGFHISVSALQADVLAKSIRRCGDPAVSAYLAGIARAAAGTGASEPQSPTAAGRAEEARTLPPLAASAMSSSPVQPRSLPP